MMNVFKITTVSVFLITFNLSYAQFGGLKKKLQKAKKELSLKTTKNAEAAKNVYHLLMPARDESKKQFLQIGENNGTKILAMASCEQCMPATYIYDTEISEDVGKLVYVASGVYIISYDENSYISVMPKKPMVALGEGIWKTFQYYNFFSTDKSKVATMTKVKVENYAIQLSKNILNKTTDPATLKRSNGVFFVAQKVKHAGNYYKNIHVKFVDTPEKQIQTTVESGYSVGTYYYLPDYSKLLGVDVYGDRSNLREYIFVESNMALIRAKYSSGNDFGSSEWGEHDYFNYFHRDQQKTRKLTLDENMQNAIDEKLATWSKQAKIYTKNKYNEKETAKIKTQRLPKKGIQNSKLEAQALVAAKNWANSYNWKEAVTKAYFTGNDWSIYRHAVTGVQQGRRINGVIVMKRPDGLCSFHYATFAQQYNGSGYQKVFTEGIVPGENKLECQYVN